MKVLIPAILLALLSAPCSAQPPTIIEQAQRSTIRIEVPNPTDEKQVFFCTGTIVGVIRAVTADHCVIPEHQVIFVNGVPGARVIKRQVDGEAYDGLILLEIPAGTGPIIKLAPQEPRVGDPVVTFGNVDRSGNRVALRRSVAGYGVGGGEKIMAIDGALVHGMSGGPVINERGELVGINQSVASGIGLATRLKEIREFLK